MGYSPFRETFELELFISTAGKSILNVGKLQNISKWEKYSPAKFANFVYFCIILEKV